ncbi:MAG: DUF4136 domain-containing protein [Kordiimonadaceae bacterium]|nr:DUF4136 domain-containing protein [Kordiimonadaceae bacterium]
MGKYFKIIVSFLVVGLLASCTQSISTNVMRFHQLPQPSGEKIVIVPMDPANKGSIEFANYASLVGNALGSYGYVPANGEKADLIVELGYGVDDGQQVVRSSPGMYGFMGYGYYGGYYNPWFPYRSPYYYGSAFYGSPYYYGGLYDPFGYYPLGMAPTVRTYTNYTRHLKMVIKPNKENAQNLYEGEVTSTGRNANLHEIMPYLVQAFFTNFPGVSGSSERISVKIPTD